MTAKAHVVATIFLIICTRCSFSLRFFNPFFTFFFASISISIFFIIIPRLVLRCTARRRRRNFEASSLSSSDLRK